MQRFVITDNRTVELVNHTVVVKIAVFDVARLDVVEAFDNGAMSDFLHRGEEPVGNKTESSPGLACLAHVVVGVVLFVDEKHLVGLDVPVTGNIIVEIAHVILPGKRDFTACATFLTDIFKGIRCTEEFYAFASGLKHIVVFVIVIVGLEDKAVVEHRNIHTDIPLVSLLPCDERVGHTVGLGIRGVAHGLTPDISAVTRLRIGLIIVIVTAVVNAVAGTSVNQAQFQLVEPATGGFHEVLTGHVPAEPCREETSPAVPVGITVEVAFGHGQLCEIFRVVVICKVLHDVRRERREVVVMDVLTGVAAQSGLEMMQPPPALIINAEFAPKLLVVGHSTVIIRL